MAKELTAEVVAAAVEKAWKPEINRIHRRLGDLVETHRKQQTEIHTLKADVRRLRTILKNVGTAALQENP